MRLSLVYRWNRSLNAEEPVAKEGSCVGRLVRVQQHLLYQCQSRNGISNNEAYAKIEFETHLVGELVFVTRC